MISKADFTADEWNIIFQAPVFAALYIIQSGYYNPAVSYRKMLAGLLAITETATPGTHSDLVKEIRTAIHSGQRPSYPERLPASLIEAQWLALEGCRRAAQLLAQRVPDSEANAYAAWLIAIGEAVAAVPDIPPPHSYVSGTHTNFAQAALENLADILNQV